MQLHTVVEMYGHEEMYDLSIHIGYVTLAFYPLRQACQSGSTLSGRKDCETLFLYLDVLDGDGILLFRLDNSEEPHMPLFVTLCSRV